MLKVLENKDILDARKNTFIWEFKIGDNILYNLNVVYKLVDDHNDRGGYCKPISILATSVVEAILADFVSRLSSATGHFPNTPNLLLKRSEIKRRLEGEKKVYQKIVGDEYVTSWKLRNFGFADLIKLYKNFELLGRRPEVYSFLEKMCRLRNRVHIKNYFGNFEKDEAFVFTESRTQEILDFMVKLFRYFERNYSRPWK